MATKTGTSVTTTIGGRLYLEGNSGNWCGGCGCNGTGTTIGSIDLGSVPAGTYTQTLQVHDTCSIKNQGIQLLAAKVSGTNFDQTTGAGATQWMPGTVSLRLVEAGNPNLDPTNPYDCVNGGCVPKITYNTPGVYASLAACESGCAKNSNCTGECISAEELAALQQAADNLRSRYCG
jgi:hypothetical protein